VEELIQEPIIEVPSVGTIATESPIVRTRNRFKPNLNPEGSKKYVRKTDRPYRKKDNPKRFFFPKEWMSFLYSIQNEEHKFFFEVLLHTGARYYEASNIRVKDINFERGFILISRPKREGGKEKGRERLIQISTELKNKLEIWIKKNKLKPDSTLGFPSIQYLDKAIKFYANKAKLNNPEDFSCHNVRKTLEMYMLALDINTMSVTTHMGHTAAVSVGHYVSTMLFNAEEKALIRIILGDLFNR
jgi:integrase